MEKIYKTPFKGQSTNITETSISSHVNLYRPVGDGAECLDILATTAKFTMRYSMDQSPAHTQPDSTTNSILYPTRTLIKLYYSLIYMYIFFISTFFTSHKAVFKMCCKLY